MKTLVEGPGRMPYYTHMGVLVEALDGWHRSYQWLLSQCEVNGTPAELGYDPMAGPHLLAPEDLDRMADLANRIGFRSGACSRRFPSRRGSTSVPARGPPCRRRP